MVRRFLLKIKHLPHDSFRRLLLRRQQVGVFCIPRWQRLRIVVPKSTNSLAAHHATTIKLLTRNLTNLNRFATKRISYRRYLLHLASI